MTYLTTLAAYWPPNWPPHWPPHWPWPCGFGHLPCPWL